MTKEKTPSLLKDIGTLFKVRLGFFVVLSSVLGWFMGVENVDLGNLLLLIGGGYLLTGASNGFNQIIERNNDAIMARTRNRPLPTGRMTINHALMLSVGAGITGIYFLYLLNSSAAILGFISFVLYAFVYTPQTHKEMIGYVAATGAFGVEPGTLFAVQFMWQFPHFWAIAWLAHEDYSTVGYKMLPFNSGLTERSASLILLYTLFCIPTSLLPWALPNSSPMVGNVALVVAIMAGLGFSWFAWRLSITLDRSDARKLMFASFIYLPLVQIIFVLDKTPI